MSWVNTIGHKSQLETTFQMLKGKSKHTNNTRIKEKEGRFQPYRSYLEFSIPQWLSEARILIGFSLQGPVLMAFAHVRTASVASHVNENA